VPRRPTRACANTAEPAKPAVKGSKIAEPPRICTVTPTTANRRGTIPGGNRKPVAHRAAVAAGRAGLGAHAKPALIALGAPAAGIRAAFGRTATTVAIFTATWKTRLHPRYGDRLGHGRHGGLVAAQKGGTDLVASPDLTDIPTGCR
jgi:hypothetical protein